MDSVGKTQSAILTFIEGAFNLGSLGTTEQIQYSKDNMLSGTCSTSIKHRSFIRRNRFRAVRRISAHPRKSVPLRISATRHTNGADKSAEFLGAPRVCDRDMRYVERVQYYYVDCAK